MARVTTKRWGCRSCIYITRWEKWEVFWCKTGLEDSANFIVEDPVNPFRSHTGCAEAVQLASMPGEFWYKVFKAAAKKKLYDPSKKSTWIVHEKDWNGY